MILSASYIMTTNIIIINTTSGQATITLKTATDTINQTILPDENHFINDINNAQATFTTITFPASFIEKIMVTRIGTTMPEIIYYNNEVTVDQNNNPSGIYNINMSQQGTIRIDQDTLTINSLTYHLTDIHSFVEKCTYLKTILSPTNIDMVQQQIDDVKSSLALIKDSDKATDLSVQIMIIESHIDNVTHNIQIMKTLNESLRKIQDLENHLSDDVSNQTEQALQGLQIGLQTLSTQQAVENMQNGLQMLSQSNLQGNLKDQAQRLQNAMNRLRLAIQDKKRHEDAINPEELIKKAQELKNEIAANNAQAMNNIGIGYTPSN